MRRVGARPTLFVNNKEGNDGGTTYLPDAASSWRTSCKESLASNGVKIRYWFRPQEQPPWSGDSWVIVCCCDARSQVMDVRFIFHQLSFGWITVSQVRCI